MPLPPRDLNTMSEAIALSSPSGRMSKQARKDAEKRLSLKLFGPEGLQREKVELSIEDKAKHMLDYAKFLRHLADGGMKPRKHKKEAEKLEKEAKELLREERD